MILAAAYFNSAIFILFIHHVVCCLIISYDCCMSPFISFRLFVSLLFYCNFSFALLLILSCSLFLFQMSLLLLFSTAIVHFLLLLTSAIAHFCYLCFYWWSAMFLAILAQFSLSKRCFFLVLSGHTYKSRKICYFWVCFIVLPWCNLT